MWEEIARRNAEDVSDARSRGRSTTRLVADEKLRAGMIEGLRGWARMPSRRGQVLERIAHAGFAVDLIADALGVVGFVFEGRPNVLADACGVIRSGNSVVLRIGSDALRTARAIVKGALDPALAERGPAARHRDAARQRLARRRLGALRGCAPGAGGGARLRGRQSPRSARSPDTRACR